MRYTDENPQGDPGSDPSQPAVPPTGTGGGGECGPGMVPESIGGDGNWRTAGPGECIDQAEFNRRVDLNIQNNPATGEGGGGVPQGSGGPTPAGQPNYGKAPMFVAPQFAWGEQWQAPTLEDAKNEPGYRFAADEGRRALEQSAAAKGILGSGGNVKAITAWGDRFAEQNYQNVFNRNLTGYQTRFGTAKDIFDRFYTGKKDEYAPKLFEWQTNAHAADLGWQNAWKKWYEDTISADEIFNKPV